MRLRPYPPYGMSAFGQALRVSSVLTPGAPEMRADRLSEQDAGEEIYLGSQVLRAVPAESGALGSSNGSSNASMNARVAAGTQRVGG